jgi:hypothetical protein
VGISDQPSNLTTTASRMDGEIHTLISLYDALDQQPSSVRVHERLLEVWIGRGDEGNEALLYSILPP